MGFKLVNLLRYKKAVNLVDANGTPILDDKGKPVTIWVRIIGDEDQQEAFKMSRVKSAQKRKILRDVNSPDYIDEIEPIGEADRDICIEILKAARSSDFTSEAQANVERPELPTLEEFAIDADAPTLEEQEKLDEAIEKSEKDYRDAISQYIQDKLTALESEAKGMSLEELREEAKKETINSMALAAFLLELEDERAWRAVYEDEACKVRAVSSIEEFRQLHSILKKQIKQAYEELEVKPDEIKN